jgi:MinD-like ATPase involved in chromosome partitioning or flagellar assembly
MLARAGRRVGIIDTDIQSPGIHVLFSLDTSRVRHCLNDFLHGNCSIGEAAQDVTDAAIGNVPDNGERPRLFLIPSSLDAADIGRILKEGYEVTTLHRGFQQAIRELDLDFLLIDTHPGVNEETLLSIAVSNTLLLVLRPDQQDFQGTSVTAELARRLDVAQLLMIVNKVPPGMDPIALRAKIAALYGADVAGVLPLNGEIASLASSGIFVNRFPQHPFTRELQRVADRLLEEKATVDAAGGAAQ